MEYFTVSENYENNNNILYLRESLSPSVFKNPANKIFADRHRVGIVFEIDENLLPFALQSLTDKIADVISISYKYNFFNDRIKTNGLNNEQRQLLITALISADLKEDKRYVKSKLDGKKEIAIDGVYNFRLSALVGKWKEICEYVPEFFTNREMNEFILYLVQERTGRPVSISNDKVYDRMGNRLNKTSLIPIGEYKTLCEVLLSGAREIILKETISNEKEFKCLKEYFGDKILFNCGEIL